MSENEKSHREEAEIRRIEAETRRIEAEQKKLDLETEQIQRNLKARFYKKPFFLQALVAGIVSIPLIWFFVKEIAIPLYQIDNIQLKYRNLLVSDSLSKAKDEFTRQLQATEDRLNEMRRTQLQEISIEYKKLLTEKEQLAQKYNSLSKSASVSEEEAKKYKELYTSAQEKVKESEAEITTIDNKIAEIERGLSRSEVQAMLKRLGYYDVSLNPNGNGCANQFVAKEISGHKVVFDKETNLIWQQSGSKERMKFRDAQKWIEKLNKEKFAGYNDWRLATLEEAMSLMEPEKKNGDLYIDPQFDRTQRWIWTADLVKGESWAWVVSFGLGECYYNDLSNYNCVRGVRSGQLSGGH